MLRFANPLPASKWIVPVPTGMEDVAERTRRSVAERTLASLGFEAMPAVSLAEHREIWLWVHPAGVVVYATGSVLGGGDPFLNNVRMSAVINEGLYPMSPLLGPDYRGTGWTDVTGEGFRYFKINLDPSVGGRDFTLLKALASVQKQGPLEGFSRWGFEAHKDTARGWMWVIGTDDMASIERQVGLKTWLKTAPAGFVFAMEQHELRQAQGNGGQMSAEGILRLRQRQAMGRLGELGKVRKRRYPGDVEKHQARQWFESSVYASPTQNPDSAALDYGVRADGFCQAAALVTALREPGAGTLLLRWLESAPEDVLARVAVALDPLEENLCGRLMAAMVKQYDMNLTPSNVSPVAMNPFVLQAFEVLVNRLGAPAIQHALDLYGGALAPVLAAITTDGMSLNAIEGMVPLFEKLDALGVRIHWERAPVDPEARLAEPEKKPVLDAEALALQRALNERDGIEEEPPSPLRQPGESWSDTLSRVLGTRHALRDQLAPFFAYLRAGELDFSLPVPSPTMRRGPRF